MLEKKIMSQLDPSNRFIRFNRYSKLKTLLWFYKSMIF